MADTPEQARIRAQLAARGNQLAPQTRPANGGSSGGTTRISMTTGGPPTAHQGPRSQSIGSSGERRAVVKGALEGGPAGAARAGVRARSKARSQAPAVSRSPGARGPQRRSSGPSKTRIATRRLTGRSSGGILLAEYFAGAFLIAAGLFTKGPAQGYMKTISDVMIRLTALTAVFFVLFLMAGSENAGKFAAWFGLLIDLGILFTATREAEITTLADEITGKGSGVEQATLTAATSGSEVGAEPSGTVLPS